MILFIKLLKESALFALSSILANKLRTFLTLLGITIGIFCIIAVFSVVDSLERQVRGSIESLGDNVVYVQKWPWQFGGEEYQWWRFASRPVPHLQEVDEILRRAQTVEAAAFIASTSRHVEYLSTRAEDVSIVGVSADYDRVRVFDMEAGRYFSALESGVGRNVAVLGYDLAARLFPDTEAIGKELKVFGRRIRVIGVFTKEGMSAFGNNHDELLMLPVHYLNSFFDVNRERYNPFIMVKARAGVSNAEMIDDLTGQMRAIRRLSPMADDNFALNETSLLSKGFDGLFALIKMAGWIIGGFSILVGGFGIANIMFVSVRERTPIIGIQKALGARNYFILLQFLFEAVLLSLIGGLVGLLLVWGGSSLVAAMFELDFSLTAANILLGVHVSIVIGLVSGFMPAWAAARMDPVEAIRVTA